MNTNTQDTNPAVAETVKPKMDAKALTKAIDSVLNDMNNVNDRLHVVAVGAMMHYEAHNDPCFIERLLRGLHKAVYREGIILWYRTYCPAVISEKTGVLSVKPGKAGDTVEKIELQPFNTDAAFKMPWFEMAAVQEAMAKAPKSIDDYEKKASGFKSSIISSINRQHKDGLITDAEKDEQLAWAQRIVVQVPARLAVVQPGTSTVAA